MINSLPKGDPNFYNRRKAEWGESGPSFAIAQDRVVSVANRTTITLNHTNNVPANSAEQQKKRTFT